MTNFTSTASTASTASAPTMAELLEIMRSIPKPPRDVFFFDGPKAAFVRELEASGVKLVSPETFASPFGYPPVSLGGIDIWEFDGKTWAGDIRDVEAARKGELPYKTIGRPVDRLPIAMLTNLA